MLNIVKNNYWSLIINLMIENFFHNGTTICVFWGPAIDWELHFNHQTHTFVNINNAFLENVYTNNIYDFEAKLREVESSGLKYDELIIKIAVAIEINYCEGFLVFQNDIPLIAEAFSQASIISTWYSLRNQFLFCFLKNNFENSEEIFQNQFFQKQPDVLVVEADNVDANMFSLKTNQFTNIFNESVQQLNLIAEIDAKNVSNIELNQLKVKKIANLEARPIILGAFDYRPDVALDFKMQPQVYDHAPDNPLKAVHADGTEVRIVKTFCELHNCTLEIYSCDENTDWGEIYDNGTGSGVLGLLIDHRIDIAVDAFYNFDVKYVDFSTFTGRSGITCIVPAPKRLVSWKLPLLPFQQFLWLGVLALLLVEICSLCITRSLEDSFKSMTESNWHGSVRFAYKTTLQLLVSQSTAYIVNGSSLRILLISCYMIDIIITALYSGGLAAILTLPTMGLAADSVERMAEFDLKWSGQTEYWVSNIAEAKDPNLQILVRNFHVLTFDEMREQAKLGVEGIAVERLVYGHFANIDFITLDDLDRYKIMVDDIYFQYTGAYVSRCWALEESFNQFVYWWHSGGLSQYWESKISADYMNKNKQDRIATSEHIKAQKEPVKLDFANFAGLIIIWIIGISLSILCFCIELVVNCNKKVSSKNTLKK